MSVFTKPDIQKNAGRTKKREIPEGLWTKCPECKEVLFTKELQENQMVCKMCEHHFVISAKTRIGFLADPGSFVEKDARMSSVDVLKFTGAKSYSDQLKGYVKKTGLKEAVVCGLAKLHERPISLAVMDFHFLGASMGSVVGEKITRVIERGTAGGMPVIIICASGGARMHEGAISLMQMAKTSGALARHAEKKLPYISVLTNPTTGGVTASFATLGDLIVAEPKAMIGFAGARVIKETTQQDLPKGFQTSEFLLDRGLIDMIVPRQQLRDTLAKLLGYMSS